MELWKRVRENRDGSYCFEGDEQPGPADAVAAIARYNLEKAGRHIRVRQVLRECDRSVRETVEAEVKAEFAMQECDHWKRHLAHKIKGGGSGREMR